MIDREKVIKGLECCASMDGSVCRECPYSSECVTGEATYQTGTAHLAADAISILKEQESVIEALKSDLNETLSVLGEQPDIVRCKDCKYCEYPNAEKEWCKKGHLHGNAKNWFCADGERR